MPPTTSTTAPCVIPQTRVPAFDPVGRASLSRGRVAARGPRALRSVPA